MSVPTKIGAFLAALVCVFGLALVVGSLVGPVGQPVAAGSGPAHDAAHDADHDAGHDATQGTDHDSGHAAIPSELPGGLGVSQDGYTLRLEQSRIPAGAGTSLDLTILGPDGAPVTSYDEEHDKFLHLVAVRRDFGGFQHVHPVLHRDGTWSVPVDLTAGAWRIFADFKPTGSEPVTLGSDLAVSGTPGSAIRTRGEQRVTRTARVGGYSVRLSGDLASGQLSTIELEVARRGRPVTDLQPYLGAYGHLVALREGDLAYLHVHPDGAPGDGTTEPGPGIGFGVEVPSAGRYHLYLDFKHAGVVRTASFVLDAAGNELTSSSD